MVAEGIVTDAGAGWFDLSINQQCFPCYFRENWLFFDIGGSEVSPLCSGGQIEFDRTSHKVADGTGDCYSPTQIYERGHGLYRFEVSTPKSPTVGNWMVLRTVRGNMPHCSAKIPAALPMIRCLSTAAAAWAACFSFHRISAAAGWYFPPPWKKDGIFAPAGMTDCSFPTAAADRGRFLRFLRADGRCGERPWNQRKGNRATGRPNRTLPVYPPTVPRIFILGAPRTANCRFEPAIHGAPGRFGSFPVHLAVTGRI